LKPNIFSDLILQILADKQKLALMSQAALEFARPKATHDIAQQLIQIV